MDSRIKKTTSTLTVFLLLVFFWTSPVLGAMNGRNSLQASLTPDVAMPALTDAAVETTTTTPTPLPTPTPTPLPKEYEESPDQTTGILFGAVFLVIIIVGGTFFTIRRKR